ncbi:MAG: ABC transporter permease [Eubacteriales bacterium]|nr:ABC transporter permease [Eubacteriales bacterium]
MILQSFKMALKSIFSNKMRSFLTMLGIIIGVLSLVVLVSLVNGATGSITDSINSLGKDMLMVSISDDYNKPIKLDDLKEIRELDHVEDIAPIAQSSMTANSSTAEESVTIVATTSSLSDIQGINISSGRFLMSPDVDNHSNVAVISSDLATELFGRSFAVGETFSISGKTFNIIGIYEDNSTSSSLSNTNYKAYIPYTSYLRMVDGGSLNISSFYVSAKEEETEMAQTELENYLLNRFYSDEDAFSINSSSAIAEAMSSVTKTLSLLLGGIAGISLLVGGIGIMNIMLVSVTERTKEIGIRKAIGAGRGVILFQFLIESLMVSLLGCLIGIFLSWLMILIINIVKNVSYGINPVIVILSVLFSMGIGIIFGIYPANKAAKMKPIDALRFQ